MPLDGPERSNTHTLGVSNGVWQRKTLLDARSVCVCVCVCLCVCASTSSPSPTVSNVSNNVSHVFNNVSVSNVSNNVSVSNVSNNVSRGRE